MFLHNLIHFLFIILPPIINFLKFFSSRKQYFLKNIKSYNQIGPQGATDLASALARCVNFQNLTLDLSRNAIGDHGAQKLALALEKCQNLSNLKLDLTQRQFIYLFIYLSIYLQYILLQKQNFIDIFYLLGLYSIFHLTYFQFKYLFFYKLISSFLIFLIDYLFISLINSILLNIQIVIILLVIMVHQTQFKLYKVSISIV
ncbi:transmembrane protein, putative (macronuclear) [Tetrahymena thermophila SB210]|uniref:Transmembrane protein, putative n=1 Tax=Tetrahymena thermophila (strain SB210) TaxID=312017 RepID=W7X2M6_TETTS|nr:transmembrane protein, putative [Tetrahymena thermophila SB210]EWS73515.1 transmembrane protein, putative [Tetrahymena thermophila SB210]|eukprot:XP_012653940.1 transmembrane protein, putative [Tetrahymena thermophila SB210]